MFFTCSPFCSDPLHQHNSSDTFYSKNIQEGLADVTLTNIKKNSPNIKNPDSGKVAIKAGVNKFKPKNSSKTITKDRRGKSKVVDIHCHYLNPEVNKKAEYLEPAKYDPSVIYANELTRSTNVKQIQDRFSQLTGIEERIRDMDKMGVDIQAVCPAPNQYYYFTDPGMGASLAREINHGIANIVAKHPDRFVGLGSVPLQNAELAVKELEYAVKKLGLRGVEINTNVNGMNLSDPKLGLDKFFSKANELGIVLFMHPVGTTQADRLVNHYFNNVIGNPLDTTIAVSHLIFDGVVARNSKIKFVTPHGGGYLAHYWARMDHAWKARPDCHTIIKSKPSSYLKKFYFDTITFDPTILRHLIDTFGPEHVLLGTDYPFDMGEVDPLGLIASVKKLSKDDRQKIEGLNAMKILKIK